MNRQILIIALLSTLVFTGSVNAALAGNPNPASVSNAIIDVGQP